MAKRKYYASQSSSKMMTSGEGSFANVPQASFMKAFPKNHYGMAPHYPDTLTDIDKQISMDARKARSMPPKTRY